MHATKEKWGRSKRLKKRCPRAVPRLVTNSNPTKRASPTLVARDRRTEKLVRLDDSILAGFNPGFDSPWRRRRFRKSIPIRTDTRINKRLWRRYNGNRKPGAGATSEGGSEGGGEKTRASETYVCTSDEPRRDTRVTWEGKPSLFRRFIALTNESLSGRISLWKKVNPVVTDRRRKERWT